MFEFEDKALKDGHGLVIGIDEAGRAPLAGPVVAAAVALKSRQFQSVIRDSKKLSESQREKAFVEIFEKTYVGIGIMNESVIDEINILQATFLAMRNAVQQLIFQFPVSQREQKGFSDKVCLLVDGNIFKSELPYKYKTIIQGDDKVYSIACASIVAKVSRDRMLKSYHQLFPQYEFNRHKGYPTLKHKMVLRQLGPTFIHRKSFRY